MQSLDQQPKINDGAEFNGGDKPTQESFPNSLSSRKSRRELLDEEEHAGHSHVLLWTIAAVASGGLDSRRHVRFPDGRGILE